MRAPVLGTERHLSDVYSQSRGIGDIQVERDTIRTVFEKCVGLIFESEVDAQPLDVVGEMARYKYKSGVRYISGGQFYFEVVVSKKRPITEGANAIVISPDNIHEFNNVEVTYKLPDSSVENITLK